MPTSENDNDADNSDDYVPVFELKEEEEEEEVSEKVIIPENPEKLTFLPAQQYLDSSLINLQIIIISFHR